MSTCAAIFDGTELGGRYSKLAHEALGVNLAAFERRIFGRWTDNGQTARAELVDYTRDQRDFGPHHREVDAQVFWRIGHNPN